MPFRLSERSVTDVCVKRLDRKERKDWNKQLDIHCVTLSKYGSWYTFKFESLKAIVFSGIDLGLQVSWMGYFEKHWSLTLRDQILHYIFLILFYAQIQLKLDSSACQCPVYFYLLISTFHSSRVFTQTQTLKRSD